MIRKYVAVALLIAAAACSGKTPVTPSPNPTPTPTPDPGPVVNNTPPVIGKFTVQGTRANEPTNFADASESVPVTVEVTDAESNVNDLKYNWSSAVGSFTGSGRSVTWVAPATVQLPTEVTLSLEIVETYTSQGKPVTNSVKGSATVSLHDSVKEVGEMARQFLLDFSDSSIQDVSFIMRNFQPGLEGTIGETEDVTKNRRDFRITSFVVAPANATVNLLGSCGIPGRNPVKADACSRIHTDWVSVALRNLDGLAAGQTSEAHGVDYIAANYYPDQKRWRLIDSQYVGDGSSSLTIRRFPSLVP